MPCATPALMKPVLSRLVGEIISVIFAVFQANGVQRIALLWTIVVLPLAF